MLSNIAQDTTNSAKNLAQQVARQMAQEPLEILKDVKEQAGVETARRPDSQTAGQPQSAEQQNRQMDEQKKFQDKMKVERRMEALQREIDDIRKQSVFKDLQRRITEGETVPLEEYPELSLEQKQVLNAQMEAVKTQMLNAKNANAKFSDVPSVHSKPSRRFGAGQKHEAEKQQTRVEKPVPPSG